MDDRLCISNMAIECGAKNGIFPVDDVTLEYVKGRSERPYEIYEADDDAQYDSVVEIDLSKLAPTVPALIFLKILKQLMNLQMLKSTK